MLNRAIGFIFDANQERHKYKCDSCDKTFYTEKKINKYWVRRCSHKCLSIGKEQFEIYKQVRHGRAVYLDRYELVDGVACLKK